MLVLQRKEGESIIIGNDTRVTILAVEGSRVRIAIEAPKEIPIFRKELLEAAEENKAASDHSEAVPTHLLGVVRRDVEKYEKRKQKYFNKVKPAEKLNETSK